MKKPEKLLLEVVINNPKALERGRGYNDAIDECEKFKPNKEEIASILRDYIPHSGFYCIDALTDALAKRIGKANPPHQE